MKVKKSNRTTEMMLREARKKLHASELKSRKWDYASKMLHQKDLKIIKLQQENDDLKQQNRALLSNQMNDDKSVKAIPSEDGFDIGAAAHKKALLEEQACLANQASHASAKILSVEDHDVRTQLQQVEDQIEQAFQSQVSVINQAFASAHANSQADDSEQQVVKDQRKHASKA